MCCNGYSANAKTAAVRAAVAKARATPNTNADAPLDLDITEIPVASPLIDGYWLSAFPDRIDSPLPDLIGYGLGLNGKPAGIQLFQNPKNQTPPGDRWKVMEIQSLAFPVAMDYTDLTGDGYNDVIICDHYGPSMDDLWEADGPREGGRVQWLKNPAGKNADLYWEAKTIGKSTGMHRLRVGHFVNKNHVQVMGFPVIRASGDRESPAPIMLYTPVYGPDISVGPTHWTEANIFPSHFRLIHDAVMIPGVNGGLDMALVSGREGVVLLYFEEGTWKYNVVSTGLPQTPGNPYWGACSAEIARVYDDSVGYVAAAEAFHGNLVTVYLKSVDAPKGAESLKTTSYWRRVVLDDFGALDPEGHTGTIHHVTTYDLDGSGVSSIIVACMGSPSNKPANKGIYVYKPTDLANGVFERTKISNESGARSAVARFGVPHSDRLPLEVASLSYYVPGYLTGPDPPNIRISRIEPTPLSTTTIIATKIDKEVLFQIPRPASVPSGIIPIMPVIVLAGKRLSLMVIPPDVDITLSPRDGFKVIYGTVKMINSEKAEVTRSIAPAANSAATLIVESIGGVITGGTDTGAVILRIEYLFGEFQGPFQTMDDVKITNVFPPSVPADVKLLDFPFIKVENLLWGDKDGEGLWNDFEFYNMTGFHVFFNDDAMENICHWQAWTLGLGETARFHNHSDKSFCEIHACISNGGGCGGMRYFAHDYTGDIDTDKELEFEYVDERSTLLVCNNMAEHGPLWKIQEGFKSRPVLRSNDTVDYPWHAWLASEFGQHTLPIVPPLDASKQKFDVWLAFEFPSSAFQD